MLSAANRDIPSVKRFFKKMMRSDHRRLPFSLSMDKHSSYPDAFTTSQKEKVLPKDCQLRRIPYLTNIVEPRSSVHQEEVASNAMFSLVPHGGANDRRG